MACSLKPWSNQKEAQRKFTAAFKSFSLPSLSVFRPRRVDSLSTRNTTVYRLRRTHSMARFQSAPTSSFCDWKVFDCSADCLIFNHAYTNVVLTESANIAKISVFQHFAAECFHFSYSRSHSCRNRAGSK